MGAACFFVRGASVPLFIWHDFFWCGAPRGYLGAPEICGGEGGCTYPLGPPYYVSTPLHGGSYRVRFIACHNWASRAIYYASLEKGVME